MRAGRNWLTSRLGGSGHGGGITPFDISYVGDHVAAGIGYNPHDGFRVSYSRFRDHGYYGGHGGHGLYGDYGLLGAYGLYGGYGLFGGYGLYGGYGLFNSYGYGGYGYGGYGSFYAGTYYPYGYRSYYDIYYHRYPYTFIDSSYYPYWTVYVDRPDVTYIDIDSPDQIVYQQSAPQDSGQYQDQAQPPAGGQYGSAPYDQQQGSGIVPPPAGTPEGVVPQPSRPPVYDSPLPQGGESNGDPQSGIRQPGVGTEVLVPDDTPTADDRNAEPATEPGHESAEAAPGKAIQVPPQERIPVNNAYLADASRQFQDGQYDQARSTLARALLNEPQNGFAQLAYALANFATGDYQAASEAIRRGAALVPDVIDLPIDIIRQYPSQEEFAKHLAALKAHVQAKPTDRDAWFLLGYLLFSSGDPKGAADAFAKAAELNPADTYAAVYKDSAGRVRTKPLR